MWRRAHSFPSPPSRLVWADCHGCVGGSMCVILCLYHQHQINNVKNKIHKKQKQIKLIWICYKGTKFYRNVYSGFYTHRARTQQTQHSTHSHPAFAIWFCFFFSFASLEWFCNSMPILKERYVVFLSHVRMGVFYSANRVFFFVPSVLRNSRIGLLWYRTLVYFYRMNRYNKKIRFHHVQCCK